MCNHEPLCLQKKRADLEKKRERAGANLPAIARRDYNFMKCIGVDPGEKIASFDFVSLEPSVTAAWSNDPMYKYATCDGVGKKPYIHRDVLMIDDVYLMVASQLPMFRDKVFETFEKDNLFDVWMDPNDPEHDAVKKHPILKSMRAVSKTAALGLERGMGVPKLCRDVKATTGYEMSQYEGQIVKDTFWEFFEGLKALRDRLHEEVQIRGYFFTRPFGFKVNCEPHKAYAHFTQAQASGVINLLMLKFFSIAKYARFRALIHDEFVFTYPELMEDAMRADIQVCLDSLNEDLGWSVPMRLGSSLGYNFGDCK